VQRQLVAPGRNGTGRLYEQVLHRFTAGRGLFGLRHLANLRFTLQRVRLVAPVVRNVGARPAEALEIEDHRTDKDMLRRGHVDTRSSKGRRGCKHPLDLGPGRARAAHGYAEVVQEPNVDIAFS